ncbi:MAG: glycoside hydrolase family 3 protein, partial [Treponema sp.]|nr:glycoside hydrolase family 3 protein [Treponema sp.]
SLGFHMNLSPVAEPLNGENEVFLETRSFGSVPETVAFSIVEIAAFKKHGVAPVAKHFPGNAGTDPHTGLPEIELSFNELAKTSLIPFMFVLTSSPDAVLMSHARVSSVDSGVPSCLSSVWIKDFLKNKFCFKGLVISDDIFMAALEKNGFPPDKVSVMALEAGVDVIMLSEKRFSSAARALLKKAEKDVQFSKLLHDAEKRVLAFKIQKGILCFKTDDKGKLKVITAESVSKKKRLYDFKASYRQGLDFYRENF